MGITSNVDANGNGTNAFILSGNELKMLDTLDTDYEVNPTITIQVAVEAGSSKSTNTITINLINDTGKILMVMVSLSHKRPSMGQVT